MCRKKEKTAVVHPVLSHHSSRACVRDVYLAGDLVDGLGQSLDVAGGDARHGDTAVLGGVDRMFLGQLVHLLGSQARVCEHTNLEQKNKVSKKHNHLRGPI